MTIDYDKDFGPNGRYAWPADVDVAERFIEAASSATSGPDCLNDDFFDWYLSHLDEHFFEDYPEEEAYELKEAAVKGRQELFKDAKNWGLPYLVTSAVYYIFSTKAEKIGAIGMIKSRLLWSFLSFDKPLFGMLRSKGWKQSLPK